MQSAANANVLLTNALNAVYSLPGFLPKNSGQQFAFVDDQNGKIASLVDDDEPIDLVVIGRCSRAKHSLEPLGNYAPDGNYNTTVDKSSYRFQLEQPSPPFLGEMYLQSLDAVRALENMAIGSQNNGPVKSIIEASGSARRIRFAQNIVAHPGDIVDDSLFENLREAYGFRNEDSKMFQGLKEAVVDKVPTPLKVTVAGSTDQITPARVKSKMIGRNVIVHFKLRHWSIGKTHDQVFKAEVSNIVILPDVDRAFTALLGNASNLPAVTSAAMSTAPLLNPSTAGVATPAAQMPTPVAPVAPIPVPVAHPPAAVSPVASVPVPAPIAQQLAHVAASTTLSTPAPAPPVLTTAVGNTPETDPAAVISAQLSASPITPSPILDSNSLPVPATQDIAVLATTPGSDDVHKVEQALPSAAQPTSSSTPSSVVAVTLPPQADGAGQAATPASDTVAESSGRTRRATAANKRKTAEGEAARNVRAKVVAQAPTVNVQA